MAHFRKEMKMPMWNSTTILELKINHAKSSPSFGLKAYSVRVANKEERLNLEMAQWKFNKLKLTNKKWTDEQITGAAGNNLKSVHMSWESEKSDCNRKILKKWPDFTRLDGKLNTKIDLTCSNSGAIRELTYNFEQRWIMIPFLLSVLLLMRCL